ncbi:hypothetical protein Nmel_012054 [Mimus melanotis]
MSVIPSFSWNVRGATDSTGCGSGLIDKVVIDYRLGSIGHRWRLGRNCSL